MRLGLRTKPAAHHQRRRPRQPFANKGQPVQRKATFRCLGPADPDCFRGARRERRDERFRDKGRHQACAAAQRRPHAHQNGAGIAPRPANHEEMAIGPFVGQRGTQASERSQDRGFEDEIRRKRACARWNGGIARERASYMGRIKKAQVDIPQSPGRLAGALLQQWHFDTPRGIGEIGLKGGGTGLLP